MDLTGAIALIFFFTSIIVIVGGMILTRHKERMTIIDKGLQTEEIKALYMRGVWKTNPLNSLKWGMLLIALGLAILGGMWLHEVYMVKEGAIAGLIALLGGAALLMFYLIASRKADLR
jgi:hypothetical protein